MAIRKVARMGHPVLRQVAEHVPVDRIGSDAVQRLVDDLLDTVEEYEGAGLAAPQVHVSQRIVVLQLVDDEEMQVWINPEITPLSDEVFGMMEGCLSVPGMRGLVARPARIRVVHHDRSGVRHELDLDDYPAVVAQHECDHLDGILYVDKVIPKTLVFLDEFRRFGLAGLDGGEGEEHD